MTKAFSFFIILAMAVQVIRPLGLPGLRKRSDFWKLAIVALAAVMLVAGLRMGLKGESEKSGGPAAAPRGRVHRAAPVASILMHGSATPIGEPPPEWRERPEVLVKILLSLTLWLSLALAAAQPANADEIAEQQAIFDATKAAILSHDIEALETMSSDFRESKSRTASGAWKLDCFYITFESARFVFGEHWKEIAYDKLEALALEWLEAYPNSKSGNITYAMALLNKGWMARGGKYAYAVTASGWSELARYGKLTREHLEKTRAFASDDPQWYATMILLATLESRPRAEITALSAEALAREPTYARTVANIVNSNLPKWGGTKASLDAAIAAIVAAAPEAKRAECTSEAIGMRRTNSTPRYSSRPICDGTSCRGASTPSCATIPPPGT
jgi:hypothetical protein